MRSQRRPFWKVYRQPVEGKRRDKCSFRLEYLLSSGKKKAKIATLRSKADALNYRSRHLSIGDQISVDRKSSTILKACR